ncbi:MAG: folylpolyglutamate synthase/dihydrofolate synthase [Holdemanella sp.]|nr:folylpolyglutamate synthase/dihydrofolate synthase [Holdemanella sp.]
MNVQEKIEKIERIRTQNHDLLLFRKWLTEALPYHSRMPKIQVAGTNGKGSTCMWLNKLIENCGYKVGLFTSPHLKNHTERIKVNSKEISLEDWERIYDMFEPVFMEKEMTMFEIDLFMAMVYFTEQEVDIAIIEVGLGGRLDASTALDYNATLITNIGWDHMEILGDSIEQITYEKAGIFKPSAYALTTEKNPVSQKVMEQIASYFKVMLGFVDMPYTQDGDFIHFTWNDNAYTFKGPKYQIDNLALALETLYVLGWPITKEVVEKTLCDFKWPGRFTSLHENPKVLIEGCHNTSGMDALIESLPTWKGSIYFCALYDKDIKGMLERLETYKCPITMVPIDSYRCKDLEQYGYPLITIDTLIEMVKNPSEDMLLCGSLYFVGDVLKQLNYEI